MTTSVATQRQEPAGPPSFPQEYQDWLDAVGVAAQGQPFFIGRKWARDYAINAACSRAADAKGVEARRRLAESTVAAYADSVNRGAHVDGVARVLVNTEGLTCGGFHTLEGISRTDKRAVVRVEFGWTDEEILVEGLSRPISNADLLKLSQTDGQADDLSLVAQVINGFDRFAHKVDKLVQLEQLPTYAKGLAFVRKNVKRESNVTASVATRGAILKAYLYYEDHPSKLVRLKKFCEILPTGQYNSIATDAIAGTLHTKLAKLDFGTGTDRKLAYQWTEYAIKHFMDGTTSCSWRPKNAELFNGKAPSKRTSRQPTGTLNFTNFRRT
jgi:hypothetical protein